MGYNNEIKIAIYGTGANADWFYRSIYPFIKPAGVRVVAVADDRPIGENDFFHGFKVRKPEEILLSDSEVLCIFLESSIGLNLDTARERLSEKIREGLIEDSDLFGMIEERGFLKDKTVLFYGDRLMYEAIAIDNTELLKSSEFVAQGEKAGKPEDYDYVFLCAHWYSSKAKDKKFEKELKKHLIACGFKGDRILSNRVWGRVLASCDRRLPERQGGRNPDKTFIVFRTRRYVGIANFIVNDYLYYIAYAERMGYHPVVDFQNFRNPYISNDKFGKENPWEWFFHQKDDVTLKEVYESKNVIIFRNYHSLHKRAGGEQIPWKEETLDLINSEYERLFPKDTDRVLGIVYRATDYNTGSDEQNPMPIKNFIKRTRKFMVEHDYQYIFLATEVEEATKAFKKEFGDKVFFTSQRRFSVSERRYLSTIRFDRENDEYYRMLEYLTVVILLSRCKAIAGVYCGAVLFSTVYNPGLTFKHFDSIDDVPRRMRIRLAQDIPKILRKIRRTLKIGEYSAGRSK